MLKGDPQIEISDECVFSESGSNTTQYTSKRMSLWKVKNINGIIAHDSSGNPEANLRPVYFATGQIFGRLFISSF